MTNLERPEAFNAAALEILLKLRSSGSHSNEF